jgi:hypothetical protein
MLVYPQPIYKYTELEKSEKLVTNNGIGRRQNGSVLYIYPTGDLARGGLKLLDGSCWLGWTSCGIVYLYCLPGVVAAAAGPHTPADVTEQRDQHPEHPVPGPRHRLAGVCPHGAGCENRGRGTLRMSGMVIQDPGDVGNQ